MDAERKHSPAEGRTPPDLVQRAGERIRTLRKARGWTVQDLAEAAEVSRRMLTQIELGQANPSIGTLARVAHSLGADFVGLTLPDEPAGSGAVVAWESAAGGSALLLGATPEPRAELWKWLLGPGERYEARPDQAGAHELHHVLTGSLTIELPDGDRQVEAGGTTLIASDQPYAYRNDGDVTVVFMRVVTGA